MTNSMQDIDAGEIQRAIYASHQCVWSACWLPHTVLGTSKKQTNKFIRVLAGAENRCEEW